jgi:hypothetical protein
MVTSRADRRLAREQPAVELFGPKAEAALDALELLELGWHDCYGEPNPSEEIIEDIWVVADGDLARLVSAVHLAVIDFRDLRLNADARRARGRPTDRTQSHSSARCQCGESNASSRSTCNESAPGG